MRQRAIIFGISVLIFCICQRCTGISKHASQFVLEQTSDFTPIPTSFVSSTIAITSTSISTAAVPTGVFSLILYPPLMMNYDPSIWEDKSHYGELDQMVNYLKARALETCKIAVQGNIGFDVNQPYETVQLGSVKYVVVKVANTPSRISSIYIEDHSFTDYDYENGVAVLVVSASNSEWKECKTLSEEELSKLDIP